MKNRKRPGMLFVVGLLVLVLCGAALPADSSATATGPQPGWEATAAGDWLRQAVPTPAKEDGLVVLALLRSGLATPGEAWVEGFVAVVQGAEPGGQPRTGSGWQLLALAAAGHDAAAAAPRLVEHFADGEAVQAEGPEAMAMALLVFGPGGLEAPAGLELAGLAGALAAARNLDGGYGTQEDEISDAGTTAKVLQALAFYRADGAVENAVTDARTWLMEHQSAFGGFDSGGSPDAAATAEAAIALACLGQDALREDAPSPLQGLAVFHNESGAFMPTPDSPPDTDLTALGLLALAAGQRQAEGFAAVYAVQDAAPAGPGADDGGGVAGPVGTGLKLPTWVLIAILAGVVAVVVILAVVFASLRERRTLQKRRQRIRQLRESGRLPPGVDPEDEDFELDFDYEYVGDELPKDDAP